MNLNSERMNEVAKLESAASKIFINEIIFTFLLQSAMREPFKANQFIDKETFDPIHTAMWRLSVCPQVQKLGDLRFNALT